MSNSLTSPLNSNLVPIYTSSKFIFPKTKPRRCNQYSIALLTGLGVFTSYAGVDTGQEKKKKKTNKIHNIIKNNLIIIPPPFSSRNGDGVPDVYSVVSDKFVHFSDPWENPF